MEVPSIFLNRILLEAAKRKASSLHLSIGSIPILRINGKLVQMDKESILTLDRLEKIINSIINSEQLAKLKKNKKIVVVNNFVGDFRFRVNIFYQKGLPSLSFNYIPNIIRSLKNFRIYNQIDKLINLNSGLLVITGPNDSGKTTTSVALIEEINKEKKKYIITLEDPIEHIFVNKKSIIEQIQIRKDVLSYADGLKHCLDEDVDLVYIGEIKGELSSAMNYILELAAGNCFVVLEMNTDNCINAIENILRAIYKESSQESARYRLADTLVGIISQILFAGRGDELFLASEVLIVNSAVKSLIREGKIYQLESIIQTSRAEGMISMKKSIEELIKEEKISREDIKKYRNVY